MSIDLNLGFDEDEVEHALADLKLKLYHSGSFIAYIAAEEYGKTFYRSIVKYLPTATGLLQLSATPVSTGSLAVRGKVTRTSRGTSTPIFGWLNKHSWKTRKAYNVELNPDLVEVQFFIPYKNWKRRPMKELGFYVTFKREAFDEPDFEAYAIMKGIENYDVVSNHYELIMDAIAQGSAEFERLANTEVYKTVFNKAVKWIERHVWS